MRKYSVGSRVLKLLQIALSIIDLSFSNSSNAHHKPKEATARISAICEKNHHFRNAEQLQDKMKCPKAAWLPGMIKTIKSDSISS